jgi:hypothetical protein
MKVDSIGVDWSGIYMSTVYCNIFKYCRSKQHFFSLFNMLTRVSMELVVNLCGVDLHYIYESRDCVVWAVEIVVTEVPLLELDDVTTVGMMAIGLGTARLETGGTSAIDVVSGVTLSAIAAIVPSLQAGLTSSFSFTVLPQCHSVILAHLLSCFGITFCSKSRSIFSAANSTDVFYLLFHRQSQQWSSFSSSGWKGEPSTSIHACYDSDFWGLTF